MTNDTTLLEYYMQGFNDELDSKEHLVLEDKLVKIAYELGRDHAIIGDDIRSVDYLTNEEILSRIKSTNLVRQ